MIEQEILSAIQDVNDVNIESEICVFESLLQCYDKQDILIQESFEDFSNKIKDIISNICKFIKGLFDKITDNVMGFQKRLKIKSSQKGDVNQIMLKVLSKSKYNKPDNIDSWSIPKINKKYVITESYSRDVYNNDDFVMESKSEIESYENARVIKIPSNKKSKIAGEAVTMATSGVVTSFSDDKKTITFTYIGTGRFTKTKVKQDDDVKYMDIKGQDKEWYSNPKVALHLMTHPETRKDMNDVVELALKVVKDKNPKDIKELNNSGKMSKIVKIFMVPEWHSYDVTFKQLSDTQAWASDSIIKMQAFSSHDVDISGFDKKTIKSLNMVIRMLMRIQISINFLSSALNNANIIDQAFYGSIKSLALLDEFVHCCIEAGIPSKYIAYNTWLVANECIRGKGEYKPFFGHARATIFPPNKKIVLKIALSGLGVVSNETEVRFTKTFIDMDRVDLIAPVIKSFEHNSIVAMERVEGNFDLSPSVCKDYAKRADEALTEYQKKIGKKLNIKMGSQHVGNVAYDNKYHVYRSIDYGVHYRET